MKLSDLIIRSGDSLRSAKLRTVLTTTAIGVGAAAMTLGLSLNDGGADYANKILTANIDGHSLWVMKKQDKDGSPLAPSRYTGSPAIWFNKVSVTPITSEDMTNVSSVQGVESVKPVYDIGNAIISPSGNDKEYQAIVNVARDGAHRTYIAGKDGNLKDDEIVLPDGYSTALGFAKPEEALDKKVDITVLNNATANQTKMTQTFTVKGVIQRSTLSLSVAPMAVLVSEHSAKTLNDFIVKGTKNEGKFVAASAKVSASENLETVKQRIIDKGYFAQTPGDVYSAMFQVVNVLRFILVLFGIIAVLTAIFGIINTQYISVLERTQEIGLMKAVGMKQKDIKKLFEIEAGLIGLVGSIIGSLIAFGLGTALNPYTSALLDLDKDVTLMQFSVGGIIGVILLLTVTALVAGVLPAKRAAHLDPIEALHDDVL